MKKIISILTAVLVLLTSLSAFAAVTGSETKYIFYSDLNLGNGKTLDKLDTTKEQLTGAFVYAPHNTAEATTTYAVVENEALVTGLYDNEKSSLLYFTSDPMSSFKGYDRLAFGFDFKLSGVTADIPDGQGLMSVTARAATPFGEAGGTTGFSAATCWYTGMSFGVSATDERNADNIPVLKAGDVTINPETTYTYIGFMDFEKHTFEAGIISGDGTYSKVREGSLNAVLKDFGGFQFAHSAGATTALKTTIDNVFVKKTSEIDFIVSGNDMAVSDSGEVSFDAFIPEYAEDVKLFVNGTFVEDIETVKGNDIYSITATLPEGTAFGENVFELRAKHAGADISGKEVINLIKEGRVLLRTFEAGEIAMAEKKYAESRQGGLYEVTVDFKIGEGGSINFRFLQNAGVGSSGTNFSGSSTPNTGWNPWRLSEERFAAANIDTTAQNWNTASLLIDYRGDAVNNNCPYTLTINGVVVDEGTHRVKAMDGAFSGFVQVGVNGAPGTVGGETAQAMFKNIQLYEYKDIAIKTDEIKATTKDGNTLDYNGAISSYGLKKIDVKLSSAVTVSNDDVTFVNSAGNVVDNATVSFEGDLATIVLDEGTYLPTDNYYVVISKNATVEGVKLGAAIKAEIVVTNNDSMEMDFVLENDSLSVSNDGVVSFDAFIPEYAEDVKLFVNDTFVENIETVKGKDIYSVTATLPEGTAFGENVFELRAKHAGADISGTKVINLIKEGRVLLRTFEAGEIAMAEKKYAETRQGGLYEVTVDFKIGEGGSINFRFLQNAGVGSSGTNFSGSSTPNTGWNPWKLSEERFAAANIDTTAQNWNTASLLIDYRGDAVNNYCPYTLTINGVVVDEGKHRVKAMDGAFSGFVQVGVNGAPGTVGGETAQAMFKNIQLYEYKDLTLKADEIKVTTKGGNTSIYGDSAISSYELEKIEVKFSSAVTVSNEGVTFVNSDGDVVDGATVSFEGDMATVVLDEGTLLPTDNYYVVISKNATVEGVKLGAAIKAEIAVSNDNSILSPAEGGVVFGSKATLSAYVPDAEKVIFCINNVAVKEFDTTSDNNIYTCEAELVGVGTKYFDVYAFSGDEVSIKSSSFINKVYSKCGTATLSRAKAMTAGESYNLCASEIRFPGRMVWETNVTIPKAGDTVNVEIGGASKFGYVYAGEGYFTLDSLNPLFGADGKVANSDFEYPIGEEFTVKYVCDTTTDMYEIYINDTLVATKKSTGNLSRAVITGVKAKLNHTDTDESGDGAPIVGAVSFYQECTAPEVLGVTFDGNDASVENGFIVEEGAESIALVFDKAYESLDSNFVIVKVDGKEVSKSASFDKDTKTLTISGVEFKAGSVVDVEIPAGMQMLVTVVGGNASNENTEKTAVAGVGSRVCQTIYVSDKNKVCVLPLKVNAGDDGILAYSKYINGGEKVRTYMLISEYSGEKLNKIAVTSAELEAGQEGCVSGYLADALSAENCKIMLWNKASLAPFANYK